MEDRNVITDELIREATGATGKIRLRKDVVSGYYRKPYKRGGVWCVRDSGWRELRSFSRTSLGSHATITFKFTPHYYGFSRQITNDGARPDWFDWSIHDVCFATYERGKPHIWENVKTYHIQARYESDIPEEFRHEDAA